MREGNSFSLSILAGRGVPCPRSGWGVPHPRLRQGVAHPRSRQVGTPSQVQMGGTPSQVWTGRYPIPGLDGGTHSADGGYPHPRSGQIPQGTPPHPRLDGIPPPSKTGWGTPSHPPISKASTCYAAGGVPIAFTQEDFLVTI